MYGEATAAANRPAMDAPRAVPDNAQSIIETIRKQAELLENETRLLADNVAGQQPEKTSSDRAPEPPPSLLSQLRGIRETLGQACQNLNRGREAGGF